MQVGLFVNNGIDMTFERGVLTVLFPQDTGSGNWSLLVTLDKSIIEINI